METGGRIYVQNGTNIGELTFNEIGYGIHVSTRAVGNVQDAPGATTVIDGAIIQNMLGRHIVSVFPITGRCNQVAIPEMDGYRLIEGKYENGVLVCLAEKAGQYDRFVVIFSQDFSAYDLRKVEDVDLASLNFTVGDQGTVILMMPDERLEVFSNRQNSGKVTEFDDDGITGDMRLTHDGSRILFFRGDRLCSITMRRK
jgi:hypothetical protein